MRKVLYLLGELTDLDIEWMITNGTRMALNAGDVLIQERQPVDALYMLLNGRLSVVSAAQNGREIAQLERGEMVGEMSFIESRPPSATVKATQPALVLRLPRAALLAKMQTDTGFAARFYRALALFLSYRLRETTAMLSLETQQKVTTLDRSADELDEDMLDTVSQAGARFDHLLRRLVEG